MKRFPFPVLFSMVTLVACQPDKSEDTGANSLTFSYEIDTVRIDAKEEFLFLNMGLFMSDYSPKNDLLYNLNPETSRLEMIDLEKNELKEIVQFDQDGPNAVKEMFTSGIKITDSGEKWFTDYYGLIHLNAAGERVGQFRLTNDVFQGDTLPVGFEIDGMGKITRSGRYFVSHYGNYSQKDGLKGLAVIDLESKTKRLIPLGVFQALEKYELAGPGREGQNVSSGITASERNFITPTDQQILHSNSAQNRLLSLDLVSGEHREIKLNSKLLSDEKPGLYPKQANSIEQFDEFNEMKKQEVTFGPWIYDYDRGYFWRVSREKSGGTLENPVFAFFITVLDRDLKQIAEAQLTEGDTLPFDGLPSVSFFRNGMLYMFLNEEDEMAFVRFKPNFD